MASALVSLSALGAAAQDRGDFATCRNDRYGFSLSYPAGTFTPLPSLAIDGGRVFVSRDGGRRIDSWAMLYAAADRRPYGRIVEQVARSYRAGDGDCG